MGGLPSVIPESTARAGNSQCRSRQNVPGRSTSRRVESVSVDCQRGLAQVRSPRGRPFRKCRERTVPTLVLAQINRRPTTRGGRLGSQVLARGPPVCLPSGTASCATASQSEVAGSAHPGGSPGQPECQVVSGPSPDGGQGSLATPRCARCTPAGRGSSTVPPCPEQQTTGLDAERERLTQLGLPPAVVSTIQSSRAPSTVKAYRSRWLLFAAWCRDRSQDPDSCPIGDVLEFLQGLLDSGRSVSTLRVFASAITSGHQGFGRFSACSHPLVKRFLRGARRMRPPPRQIVPPWDLQTVLDGLEGPPFEPLDSAEIRFLSFKTVVLLALSSAKRVGDLCALSVHPSCISFSQDGGLVHLWPNPAFHPKVITSDFRSRVIRIRALCTPPDSDERVRLQLLCPVRALRCYIERTAAFRTTDRLFVRFGTKGHGAPLSSQRLAHWVCDGIATAYQARGCPPPSVIRAHSTRGVSTSVALSRGVTVSDICQAASWSSVSTFVRSYLMDMSTNSMALSVLGDGRVPVA